MRRKLIASKTKQLLIHRAQLMRAFPSALEEKLWRALRSGKLGVPFRRQVVVACSIVDLDAPRASLVAEVDGAHHRAHRTRKCTPRVHFLVQRQPQTRKCTPRVHFLARAAQRACAKPAQGERKVA